MSGAKLDSQSTKLWDWPVRIIHWSFVLLLPALWWTWKSGQLPLHELLGYIMLGLLIFRLYWGFFGSSTARFAGFVKGPRAIAAYVRTLFSKAGEPVVGHNPLGGLSVIALLGLLLTQVTLGLFTQDVDGMESGPLTYLVSYEFADGARGWHGFLFNVLLAIVALHVCAIVFYLLVKRDNLVGPMLTGRKQMPELLHAPRFAPLWRGLLGVALSAAIAYWVSKGCPIPWMPA